MIMKKKLKKLIIKKKNIEHNLLNQIMKLLVKIKILKVIINYQIMLKKILKNYIMNQKEQMIELNL